MSLTVTAAIDDTAAPFSGPYYAFTSPDSSTCLVCNLGNGTVGQVDVATDTVTTNISGSFAAPARVRFSADSSTAFVTDLGNSTVSIVDIATSTVTGLIDDSSFPFSAPYAINIADF